MIDPNFLSYCCSAPVRIAGERSTHWHVCTECNKPPDAIRLRSTDEYAEAFAKLADS